MVDLQGQPSELKKLLKSIDLSPIAMLVTDPTLPDNPIRFANAAFCALTGYEKPQILGRNCRFLAGPGTDPADSAELKSAIQQGRPALVEIVNQRRDGTPFRNSVMITPLFDSEGKPRWFLGSQVDLSDPESGGLTARKDHAQRRISALSPRQRQVLALIARGLLNKQIAGDLEISLRTVETHRLQLLRQLGVRSSAEAIRLAIEAGL